MQTIYDSFYNRGFCVVNDKEVFKHIEDIESWEWKNLKQEGLQLVVKTPEVVDAINKTQLLLAEKYVRLLDPNYTLGGDCEIVNGMDEATLSWHNDKCEGFNLCILLYWDTMDEEIGGQTCFRNISSLEVMGGFYPQKYDVSFMNHCSRFEHIVTPLKLPMNRRVALFNYNISEELVG